MRVLRGVPERQLAGRRRELRHRAARLHRRRDQPLLDDAIADDDVGRLECGGRCRRPRRAQWKARLPGASACSCGAPAAAAFVRIDHGGQRFVVDVDQLERVVGLIVRFGDDHGDRIADVTDDVGRDARDRARRSVRHSAGATRRECTCRPASVSGAGEHRHDAGGAPWRGWYRCRGSAHVRAGCGGPPRAAMPGQREIGGVASRAGQEPRVLAPPDARTEDSCGRRLRVVVIADLRFRATADPLPQPARRGRCSGSRCSGTGCPSRPCRICSTVGFGSRRRISCAANTMPGVQKPHCSPCFAQKASCSAES